MRAARLHDSRLGCGIQPTWPAGRPLLWAPIDHCLVSKHVIVHSRRVSGNIGSDHYPVVIDFSIRQ